MSNAFKDWLRGLAQSGSNPVGTAMSAYGLGVKRKQSMLDEEYRKRSLGIQGAQVENSREKNRLTGIGHGIAQGRLDLDTRTADPAYTSEIERIKADLKHEVNAGPAAAGIMSSPTVRETVNHPGGEELAGPPALPDEPLGEERAPVRQPWTEQVDREATGAEKRRALKGALYQSTAIEALPGIQAEKLKQKGILERLRTQADEGLYPGVQARRESGKGLTPKERLTGNLGLLKATTETDRGGAKTFDEKILDRVTRSLDEEETARTTQTSTVPPIGVPQQRAFDQNIRQDPSGRTPVNFGAQQNVQPISHKEVAQVWLPILQDPSRRAVAFSQLTPQQIPALLPLIRAMHDAGMMELTDEEVLKLADLGTDPESL